MTVWLLQLVLVIALVTTALTVPLVRFTLRVQSRATSAIPGAGK